MSSHPDIVVRLPPAHAYVKHEDIPSPVVKHHMQPHKTRAIEATTMRCRPEVVVRLPPASAYSSKHEDTPSVVTESLLFKLPRELRDMIYRFALLSKNRIMITKWGGIPEPGLLSVNKLIRSETIAIFYQNPFHCDVLNYDDTTIRIAIKKVASMKARHSLEVRVGGTFHWRQRNWKNLVSWLHACQQRRSVGIVERASDSPEDTLIRALFARVFDKPVMTAADMDAFLKAMRPVFMALHSDWGRDYTRFHANAMQQGLFEATGD